LAVAGSVAAGLMQAALQVMADEFTGRSVFLEEDAPARGVDRHGEVGENSRAEESGFTGEKLPCVKARLHTADAVFGEIDNCIDIRDRPT
jgi:hypothetical protein